MPSVYYPSVTYMHSAPLTYLDHVSEGRSGLKL